MCRQVSCLSGRFGVVVPLLLVVSAPSPQLGGGDGVGLFGVPKGGLQVAVPKPLADGGQADPAVDELGGVEVAELVQGRRDAAGGGGAQGREPPQRLAVVRQAVDVLWVRAGVSVS
jgi:hypothetical protein